METLIFYPHVSPWGVLSKLKTKVETATEEVSRIEAAKTELQAQVRSKPVVALRFLA